TAFDFRALIPDLRNVHAASPESRLGHSPDLPQGSRYSCRSAAIGSSRAAWRAGYTPNARPTRAQNVADSRIGTGAHATCQPAKAAIAYASAVPNSSPSSAPELQITLASRLNCATTSRRTEPCVRRRHVH